MNLPEKFSSYILELLGKNGYKSFLRALEDEVPVSIRLNSIKHFGFERGQIIPWTSKGYYLSERPTFTFDPLFHAGCYYVQEASSMFLEKILCQYVLHPVKMLDLCAAPGGKSTLACSVLPEGSLLIANEIIRQRAHVLEENLIKWGYSNIIVTNNDSSDFSFLKDYFDVILADVPCSGEGMFRKDPDSMLEWSPANVDLCWKRQRQIIDNIWPCLKPGGLLIYSTCTYNLKEDEENVEWVKEKYQAELLDVDIPPEWGIVRNLSGKGFPVFRFLPHCTKGEGFFIAILRKPFSDEKTINFHYPSEKKKKSEKLKPFPKECVDWLRNPDHYKIEVRDTTVIAFPKIHIDDFHLFDSKMKVIYAGIELAKIKGKDNIPSHSLAMSQELNNDAFPAIDVNYDQAITYLHKEVIQLPTGLPRSYVLLTYCQIPIGFVKNIGNRANNLYPQEWRIRSSFLPEKVICL